MTVHDLHDALTLLPGDLIAATDHLRTHPKPKGISWKQWGSLAACVAVLIAAVLTYRMGFVPEIYGMKDAKMESAAQSPAAMAPMAPQPGEQEAAADEAIPEEPAAEAPGTGAMSGSSVTDSTAGMEEELCIDHSHRFAEEMEEDRNAVGYCGNMMTTVYLDGTAYSFAGADSVTVTDILVNLEYDPDQRCRCMAEFQVDTELLTGIEVNLTQSFARCEQGQAPLTEKQVKILQEVLDRMQ